VDETPARRRLGGRRQSDCKLRLLQRSNVAPALAAIPPDILRPRLGFTARLQIANVVLPGALLLLEVWVLANGGHNVLKTASKPTEGVTNWVLALAAVAILLLIIFVGIFGRSMAWNLFERRAKAAPRRWRSHALARVVGPIARRDGSGAPDVDEALRQIRAGYGPDAVNMVVEKNTRVAEMFQVGDVSATRSYVKGWLQTRAPALSIEDHQIEISFLVAAVWPIGLAPWVGFRLFGWPWQDQPGWNVATVFAAILLGFLFVRADFRRATTRRTEELEDGIRNYFLAHWF